MTPRFAEEIDPVFEYVLGMLDRIESGEEPHPEQARTYFHSQLLNRAERKLGATADWAFARKALIYWTDEVLTNAHWQGRGWWINNPLEVLLLEGHAERAKDFFVNAKKAMEGGAIDALEVYYLCVILGFRGLYENPDAHALDLAEHQLPPQLQEWLKIVAEGIRASPAPTISKTGRVPTGAPPLGGRDFFLSSLIVFLAAAAVFLAVAYHFQTR
jgi:type VI secretion system protein ImpK